MGCNVKRCGSRGPTHLASGESTRDAASAEQAHVRTRRDGSKSSVLSSEAVLELLLLIWLLMWLLVDLAWKAETNA